MNLEDDDGVDQPENSGLFTRTHWSVVLRAKDESTTALDTLFTKYRRTLIIYLINRRYTPDRAEEVVQGFCAHLLKRKKKHFLADVAPDKGKFRSFLLASLKNFISDEISEEKNQRHGGGTVPDSLDATDSDGEALHSPKSSAPSADLEYDKAWAHTILRNSLRQLEEEYAAKGHAQLYQALEPAIHDDETSPSYGKIAAQMEMTEGAVKVAAHRVRNRLRELIREELMQTVSNEVEFKEELAYFISVLGHPQP